MWSPDWGYFPALAVCALSRSVQIPSVHSAVPGESAGHVNCLPPQTPSGFCRPGSESLPCAHGTSHHSAEPRCTHQPLQWVIQRLILWVRSELHITYKEKIMQYFLCNSHYSNDILLETIINISTLLLYFFFQEWNWSISRIIIKTDHLFRETSLQSILLFTKCNLIKKIK